ncbi:IclR family transcriptional regulator domain-containing protein, partial [Amycolatopsis jejuensis]|uniref:IclR family transcriptional regulator domain-containing protein n=1 Tax=Amycolatopsis jejuensis TaxID=330084 RepID=UPI000526881A
DTLHRERQTACCIAIDELEAGHMSIAAPVRDSTNCIIASVNVAGPKFRLADRVETLSATVKVAARRLSSIMADGPSGARPR